MLMFQRQKRARNTSSGIAFHFNFGLCISGFESEGYLQAFRMLLFVVCLFVFSDCFSLVSAYVILKINYVDVVGIAFICTFNAYIQTVRQSCHKLLNKLEYMLTLSSM